jgi:hypothetical protein
LFRVQEIHPAERVRRSKVNEVHWRLEDGVNFCGSFNGLARIIGSDCRYRVKEIEVIKVRSRNRLRRDFQICCGKVSGRSWDKIVQTYDLSEQEKCSFVGRHLRWN